MESNEMESLVQNMQYFTLSDLLQATSSTEPVTTFPIQNSDSLEILSPQEAPLPIVFSDRCEALLLLYKWPKMKTNVASIFLHNPLQLNDHVEDLLTKGIKFYKPLLRQFYTKINCPTHHDYKHMIRYLERHGVPFHTYSHAICNYLEFAIRGLPDNIDLKTVRTLLRAASIPVRRIHRIRLKTQRGNLVMISTPVKDECKRLLWVKSIFGYNVSIEQPITNPKQCNRCQRWEHSEMYCRGEVRCVYCSENHFWSACNKDFSREPPTCANCSGRHTADYKKCYFCPASKPFKAMDFNMEVVKQSEHNANAPPELVTFENYHQMYANLKYGRLD